MSEAENLLNGQSSSSGQLSSSNDVSPLGSEQSSLEIQHFPLRSDQTPCRNDELSSGNDEPSINCDLSPLMNDQSPLESERSPTDNDRSKLNSDQSSVGSEQLPLMDDQLSVTNDQSVLLLESEPLEDSMEIQETPDPIGIESSGVSMEMVGITKSVNPVVQQGEVNSNSNPFAEYEWMGQEEEFDKKVLAELEEEEFIEICFEEMLAEEEADCFYPPIELQLPGIEKVQEVASEQVMEHVGHDQPEMSEENHECEETSDFILGSSPQR